MNRTCADCKNSETNFKCPKTGRQVYSLGNDNQPVYADAEDCTEFEPVEPVEESSQVRGGREQVSVPGDMRSDETIKQFDEVCSGLWNEGFQVTGLVSLGGGAVLQTMVKL